MHSTFLRHHLSESSLCFHSGLQATAVIRVTISDEPDAPVIATPFGVSVPENSPASTDVVTFTATDQDAGDSVTWSIVEGNNGGFSLHSSSGLLTVADASKLNHEATPSISYELHCPT